MEVEDVEDEEIEEEEVISADEFVDFADSVLVCIKKKMLGREGKDTNNVPRKLKLMQTELYFERNKKYK